MEQNYLTEAFKSLQILDEEDFNLSDSDDVVKMKDFENAAVDDTVSIIDPEADDKENLKDNYIGDIICRCEVCHSDIYKKPTDIVIDEESQLANIGEECPYCFSADGFKILGQVAPFSIEDEQTEKEVANSTETTLDDKAEEAGKELDEATKQTWLVCPKCGKKLSDCTCNKDKKNLKEGYIGQTVDDFIEDCNNLEKVIVYCYDISDDPIYEGDPADLPDNIRYAQFDDFEAEAMNVISVNCSDVEDLDESLKEGLSGAVVGGAVGSAVGHPLAGAAAGSMIQDTANKVIDSKLQEDTSDLPEMCYVDTITDGIGIVKRGESGYYQTDIAQSNHIDLNDEKAISDLVDLLNRRLGVSVEEARAMKIGSMYGWDVPGAKADNIMNKRRPASVNGEDEAELAAEGESGMDDSDLLPDEQTECLKEAHEIGGFDTEEEASKYWDENHTDDPVLVEYGDDKEAWLKDSKENGFIGESLKEDMNKVVVLNDEKKVEVVQGEDGKTKVEIEPCDGTECPDKGHDEEIVPVDTEMKTEIEANSDIAQKEPVQEKEDDMDEFDDETFSELGESFLKKVYENVNSFKTSNVTETSDNKLIVEGLIKFNSGKEKKTSFMFEQKETDKKGRITLLGENLQLSRGTKSFALKGKLTDKKFIAESLTYRYMTKDNDNKSVQLYGTVKTTK